MIQINSDKDAGIVIVTPATPLNEHDFKAHHLRSLDR